MQMDIRVVKEIVMTMIRVGTLGYRWGSLLCMRRRLSR